MSKEDAMGPCLGPKDNVEVCIGTKEGRLVVVRHENGNRDVWIGDQKMPAMTSLVFSLDYSRSPFVWNASFGFHVLDSRP